jgi:hypothetical protein
MKNIKHGLAHNASRWISQPDIRHGDPHLPFLSLGPLQLRLLGSSILAPAEEPTGSATTIRHIGEPGSVYGLRILLDVTHSLNARINPRRGHSDCRASILIKELISNLRSSLCADALSKIHSNGLMEPFGDRVLQSRLRQRLLILCALTVTVAVGSPGSSWALLFAMVSRGLTLEEDSAASALRSWKALNTSARSEAGPARLPGLFAAAESLGFGFVHGVPPHFLS